MAGHRVGVGLGLVYMELATKHAHCPGFGFVYKERTKEWVCVVGSIAVDEDKHDANKDG